MDLSTSALRMVIASYPKIVESVRSAKDRKRKLAHELLTVLPILIADLRGLPSAGTGLRADRQALDLILRETCELVQRLNTVWPRDRLNRSRWRILSVPNIGYSLGVLNQSMGELASKWYAYGHQIEIYRIYREQNRLDEPEAIKAYADNSHAEAAFRLSAYAARDAAMRLQEDIERWFKKNA